jgi:hypothetical protein
MNQPIYEKTEKGREEIMTRKYQLPTKLRTLLVLIDGEKSSDKLFEAIAPLGLNEQNLNELLEQEYIRERK